MYIHLTSKEIWNLKQIMKLMSKWYVFHKRFLSLQIALNTTQLSTFI